MMITPTPTLIRFLREMAAQTMKTDDKVACALGEAADRLEANEKRLREMEEMIIDREEWLRRKDAFVRDLQKQITEITTGEK